MSSSHTYTYHLPPNQVGIESSPHGPPLFCPGVAREQLGLEANTCTIYYADAPCCFSLPCTWKLTSRCMQYKEDGFIFLGSVFGRYRWDCPGHRLPGVLRLQGRFSLVSSGLSEVPEGRLSQLTLALSLPSLLFCCCGLVHLFLYTGPTQLRPSCCIPSGWPRDSSCRTFWCIHCGQVWQWTDILIVSSYNVGPLIIIDNKCCALVLDLQILGSNGLH